MALDTTPDRLTPDDPTWTRLLLGLATHDDDATAAARLSRSLPERDVVGYLNAFAREVEATGCVKMAERARRIAIEVASSLADSAPVGGPLP